MSILPNVIYRFSVIPVKLPITFFTELDQISHYSYGNTKDPNSQSNLEKENRPGGINLPDFRL